MNRKAKKPTPTEIVTNAPPDELLKAFHAVKNDIGYINLKNRYATLLEAQEEVRSHIEKTVKRLSHEKLQGLYELQKGLQINARNCYTLMLEKFMPYLRKNDKTKNTDV
jgi:hypothetical protein